MMQMMTSNFTDQSEWKNYGIDITRTNYGSSEKLTEEETKIYITDLTQFLKSLDFMKLGQAVSHDRWESAAMIIRRMDSQAKALGLVCMERPFTGLRQSVNRKNMADAKQILAGVISKRVQLLKML